MYHNFYIKTIPGNNRDIAYVEGLPEVWMYDAFDLKHHYIGVGGDNLPEMISRKRAIHGLDIILSRWTQDQKKIENLRIFRAKCDNEYAAVKDFVVCFS